MVLRRIAFILACCLTGHLPASAQDGTDTRLIGELMAFHGSRAIVSVMTTHCYETTGLDPAFKIANDNWYLRNIGFLELADRVIERLGGGAEGQQKAAETYGGSQIMSAYNQAPDKTAFCQAFLDQVDSGDLDIDKALPKALAEAQAIGSE